MIRKTIIILIIVSVVLICGGLTFYFITDTYSGTDIKVSDDEKSVTKIKFDENNLLAIGHFDNETEMLSKCFEGNVEIERKKCGDNDNFIIIPKKNNAVITIKRYTIDNDGDIWKQQALLENYSGVIILNTNEISVNENIYIEYYDNSGMNFEFDLKYDENGKLQTNEYVKDISIY